MPHYHTDKISDVFLTDFFISYPQDNEKLKVNMHFLIHIQCMWNFSINNFKLLRKFYNAKIFFHLNGNSNINHYLMLNVEVYLQLIMI